MQTTRKPRPWSLYRDDEFENWPPDDDGEGPEGPREVLKQAAAVLLVITAIIGACAVVAMFKL